MRQLLATLLLLLTCSAQAGQVAPLPLEQCASMLPAGEPMVKKQRVTKICRPGYFTIYDNNAKIPLVTVYVLKPAHVLGCESRDGSFEEDHSLPPGDRATSKDYAKSGYDVGHLANSADLRYNAAVRAAAPIYSNTAPMLPGFNRGIWKRFENRTRAWAAERDHDIQVIIGSIHHETDSSIGQDHVGVPGAFFRVLIDLKTGEMLAFIVKHEASSHELALSMNSLAEIQRQSGVTIPRPKNSSLSNTIWPSAQKSTTSQHTAACAIR